MIKINKTKMSVTQMYSYLSSAVYDEIYIKYRGVWRAVYHMDMSRVINGVWVSDDYAYFEFPNGDTVRKNKFDDVEVKTEYEPEYDTVSLHIKRVWKGAYRNLYYWQVFVNGDHFMSAKNGYYFEHEAREAGVLSVQKIADYFTHVNLSDEY